MFSKEIVNTGRQKELDISKTIAIVFMIFCHVGIYFADIETTLGIIDEVLGEEFGAPVFMVCMSVGTIFSKHNSPDQLVKSGL